MSQTATLLPGDEETFDMRAMLRKSELAYKLKSLALIAPLFLFVLVCFAFPSGTMLSRSVDTPEVNTAMPATTAALSTWPGHALADERSYVA